MLNALVLVPRMRMLAISGLYAVSLFMSPVARAQSYLTQVGNTTFSTTLPVELGNYDASTGNLHMEIPLGTWPQRGGHTLTAALVYDSRIWYISGNSWQPGNIPGSQGGWRFVTSGSPGQVNYLTQAYQCNVRGTWSRFSNFSWTSANGTLHQFPITTILDHYNCNGGSNPTGSAYANDASGYYMSVTAYTSATVYAPDGSQVYPSYKDTNGNYYSTDANGNLVDTLGRTPVKVTTDCNSNPNETCYDVLNSQGGTSRYTVVATSVSVSTAFHQSGITEYSGSVPVISTITLPDNKYYSFTYDYVTYGELTGVTLPTGGLISYTYTTFFDAYNNANRWLFTHTSGGGQWTYAPSVAGGICVPGYTYCQMVMVTKPSGDNIRYSFESNGGSNGSWQADVTSYQGSTIQLYDVQTAWTTGLTKVQKQSVTSTPDTGGQKTTQYIYVSSSLPFIAKISEWNSYPLNSQPSTPDRITTLSSYCDASPGSITVTNGAGTQTIAQTNTTFDSYGSGLISMTGITHHDDTNFGTGYTTRCNPTSISKLVGSSTYVTTSMTYDTTGQVRSVTDPNNNMTTLDYTDNFFNDNDANPPASYTSSAPTNAYLKTVTVPVIGAQTFGYYYGTGQTALSTDQNGATSYAHDYDSFSRPTETLLPDGGWNAISYSTSETEVDSYLGITNATPSTSCPSGCRHDETTTDTLGRPNNNYLVSDPDGETTVATSYDSSSRVSSVTNPYRSASNGQDSYSYDGLDRVTQIAHTDGTAVNVIYGYKVALYGNPGIGTQLCSSATYGLGYPTLTLDEAGKMREVWTDGFGRTIEVDEPDATNKFTKNTCYGYDLNNDLTKVVSATGQTRTYAYDDLSRLTSVATPETFLNGTQYYTAYSYTNSGLCSGNPSAVCVRTDPRGIMTTYRYDALNRPTSITYSDSTPTVTYCYDGNNSACISGYSSSYGKGRRTAMSDGSGNTGWSYSPTGRSVSEKRTIAGVTKTISYSYNLDGSVASITYPSGRVVSFNVGGAERPLSATDSNGSQYAITASYSEAGALKGAIYGQVSGGFGGATETRQYNNRLELTSIQASSTNGNAINLAPCFTAFSISSNPLCSSSSTGNNGSVSGIVNSVDPNETQAFGYDNLNRISSGVTKATSGNDCWGQSFGIDAVANLTSIGVTQCSAGPLNTSTDGYNHLTGYSYDNTGDMVNDGAYTYTYDAERRVASANGVNYVYDGDGLRVKKSSGTVYWRSIAGDAVAESDLSGNIQNEYVFFAGRRIARISGSTVNYFYSDALGTTHTITDATGHPCYDASFTPYGEEVLNPNISQTCSSNYKFTGYEYDSETGNYYAFARYYSWRLGRFMSPDPMGGETLDPQSGNAYAYVLNAPCNLIDPFGFAPSCSFNVAVYIPDDALTGDALKAVEAEIQDIFANSSLNQPVSVGVNFTSGSNADFSLTFSNAGVPGSGIGGEVGGIGPSPSADVYVNNLQYGLLWQSRVLGVTGAHELGHTAGFHDITYTSKASANIMTLDTDPANAVWDDQNPMRSNYSKSILFSPKQLQSLFNECKSKRRRTGGGGAGNGGYFLEPITSCGYEEVEGGPEQWGCKVVGYRYVFY